jgi:hypothetical protein
MLDNRQRVEWACECAQRAVTRHTPPNEHRPQAAIDAALGWCAGVVGTALARDAAAYAADAADAATDAAAYAAAYAADAADAATDAADAAAYAADAAAYAAAYAATDAEHRWQIQEACRILKTKRDSITAAMAGEGE